MHVISYYDIILFFINQDVRIVNVKFQFLKAHAGLFVAKATAVDKNKIVKIVVTMRSL